MTNFGKAHVFMTATAEWIVFSIRPLPVAIHVLRIAA
jgi:hypothetical protein